MAHLRIHNEWYDSIISYWNELVAIMYENLTFYYKKHNQGTAMSGKMIIQVDQMYVKRLIWCGQIGIRKGIG
jgi:hypothetical protein